MVNFFKTTTEENEPKQKYVDLLSNSGFKAVFGDRDNDDVVMSIMNTLLPEHRKVTHIECLPTEHQGLTLKNKEFRYDFMCKGQDGTSFIVEVERQDDDNWFKRCVSYAARAYDRHNKKGQDYDVQPVYLIGLMGIDIPHPDKELWKNRYISEYTFREKGTHDLLAETIIIIFAELTRFNKTLEECEGDLDKLCYIFKHGGKLNAQPDKLKSEKYDRIFEACEIAAFSEEKRTQYEIDMMEEREFNSKIKTAERKGEEKGEAKGEAKGRKEQAIKSAQTMLEDNISIDLICKYTGLTLEEVQALQQ